MNYLTQILQKSVFGPDGVRVGKVHDAIATVGGRLPTVTAIFVKGKGREGWIDLGDAELREDGFHLVRAWDELPAYEPKPDDMRLQRDILDKQIVDVHDYRVVRVNDVRLAECGDRMCVVGVDAGPRALLRRAGIGRPVEALAKLVGKPLQSNLISWDDVETLEPSAAGGGRIKLKVSSEKIARLHPADIADIVEQLDPQQRTEVIESLDVETAADTIAEMEDEEAAAVIVSLEDEHAADILEEMDPDAAADLLADLKDEEAADILEEMEPEEAAEVQELMAYDEETAGGLMTTELVSVKATLTCEQTIQRLRELAPKAESIYYVYVVDDDDRLLGVISLRDLIVADPNTHITEAMVRNVRHVHTSDHADEVGQLLNRYNLLAIPVVDDDGRLVGMITVDDLMERLLPPEKRRRLPQLTVDGDGED
jgi:CBS domain-containing protein